MGVVCSPLFHIIPSQLTCEFQASRVWPQMTNRSNSYTHMAKIDALYNGYFPKYGNNRFWTVHISLTLSMVTLHCLVCGSSIPGLFQTSSGLLPFLEDTVSIDDYRYLLIFHFPEHWIFFLTKSLRSVIQCRTHNRLMLGTSFSTSACWRSDESGGGFEVCLSFIYWWITFP